MKRSTVLDLKHLRFFDGFVKNKLLIILALSFLIGLIAGAVTYSKSEILLAYAEDWLSDFLSDRADRAFMSIFISSLFSGLLFLLAIFLSGTSLLGIILAPLLVALRGFLYTNAASCLYSSYGVKGVAFHAVIIIPVAVIYSLTVLTAAKYSVSFSYIIARMTMPRSAPASLYDDFRKYCIKFALLILLVVFSALVDAVLSRSFIGSFNL